VESTPADTDHTLRWYLITETGFEFAAKLVSCSFGKSNCFLAMNNGSLYLSLKLV